MTTPLQLEQQLGGGKQQLGKPRKSKTRGIQFIDRPGVEKPFGIQWPEWELDPVKNISVRKRKTKFFRTQEARETKATELRDARSHHATTVTPSLTDQAQWRTFMALIGTTPLMTVYAGWQAHIKATGIAACSKTVAEAAKTYCDQALDRQAQGKLSLGYQRHLDRKIKLLVDQFGDMKLDAVTKDDIEDWIDGLDGVESDGTFDNYAKHIRAFFSHFVEEKVINENPALRIKRRGEGMGEVVVITPAETARLLHVCRTNPAYRPMINRLALECFIGMRFETAAQITKPNIKRADKGVNIPAEISKDRRRHYLDGLPDNLWSWLDVDPDAGWDMTPRQYMGLKSALFTAAQVPHPRNCLRHGFVTYHVAAFKDPGRTAFIICHTKDQNLLYEHYKGMATDADGKLFWTITPQTAESLAKSP